MGDDLVHLFAAYSVIWVALASYIFTLSRRQKKIWREIETLKESLNRNNSE